MDLDRRLGGQLRLGVGVEDVTERKQDQKGAIRVKRLRNTTPMEKEN